MNKISESEKWKFSNVLDYKLTNLLAVSMICCGQSFSANLAAKLKIRKLEINRPRTVLLTADCVKEREFLLVCDGQDSQMLDVHAAHKFDALLLVPFCLQCPLVATLTNLPSLANLWVLAQYIDQRTIVEHIASNIFSADFPQHLGWQKARALHHCGMCSCFVRFH